MKAIKPINLASGLKISTRVGIRPLLAGAMVISGSTVLADVDVAGGDVDADVQAGESVGKDQLLKQLNSENFKERTAAQGELEKWAKKANKSQVEELLQYSEDTDSPEVRDRLRDVIKNNAYLSVPNTRGFMGIQMQPFNGGVMISRVEANQPADKAGLKAGDLITELDGNDLSKMNNGLEDAMDFLRDYVKDKKEGEKLELKIQRGENTLEKELKLGNYDTYMENLNELGGIRGANGLQFRIAPGGAGQMQIFPQQIDPEELAKIQEMMLELRKNNKGGVPNDDALKEMQKMFQNLEKMQKKVGPRAMPEMKLENGNLELKFEFGQKNQAEPAKPPKPAKPAEEDAKIDEAKKAKPEENHNKKIGPTE